MVENLGVPKKLCRKGEASRTLWLEPHVMYCDSSGWYRTPLKTFGSNRASTRTPRVRSHTMHEPSADPDIHCSFSLDTFRREGGGAQRHVHGITGGSAKQRGVGGSEDVIASLHQRVQAVEKAVPPLYLVARGEL